MSILCIGAAHVDYRGVLRGPVILRTSNRGDIHRDFGGVARNVAENLTRLGLTAAMLSRVGEDANGTEVLRHLRTLGVDTTLVTRSPAQPTASYTAVLESCGELVIGLNDADIYEEITPELIEAGRARMREHAHWFVDTNIPGPTIGWLLDAAATVPVFVDGVSVARAPRLLPVLSRITLLFTNLAQAQSIAGAPLDSPEKAAQALFALGAHSGVLTNGAAGALAWEGGNTWGFPAFEAHPRDVTGAGDALIAGTLSAILQGADLNEAVPLGLAAAAITVESEKSTSPELNPAKLQKRTHA